MELDLIDMDFFLILVVELVEMIDYRKKIF